MLLLPALKWCPISENAVLLLYFWGRWKWHLHSFDFRWRWSNYTPGVHISIVVVCSKKMKIQIGTFNCPKHSINGPNIIPKHVILLSFLFSAGQIRARLFVFILHLRHGQRLTISGSCLLQSVFVYVAPVLYQHSMCRALLPIDLCCLQSTNDDDGDCSCDKVIICSTFFREQINTSRFHYSVKVPFSVCDLSDAIFKLRRKRSGPEDHSLYTIPWG